VTLTTPAPADGDGVVIVDVEPSPGALKFLGTVSNVGNQLSTLETSDVSDGMLELSKTCTSSMKSSFSTFKEHALDLAITASSDSTADEGRLRTVYRQSEFVKLVQLPLAGMYAIAALLCLITFAAIYFPKLYAPVLINKARTKFIEWHVAERASEVSSSVVDYSSRAYTAAASSQIAAKATETASVGYAKAAEAYTTVASNPAVVAVSAKSGEAASQVRAKLSTELQKMRGNSPSSLEEQRNGDEQI
jgi:hypothetical protein